MSEQTTVAIFGAAGSMGTRSSNALKDEPAYEVLCVEAGAAGISLFLVPNVLDAMCGTWT